MEKTRVVFNRQVNAWQAVGPHGTETFYAGPAGKRRALWSALAADHPQLFPHVQVLADQHGHEPEIVDRLLAAAALLTKRMLFSTGWVMSSENDGGSYFVSWEGTPRQYSCSCPDFQFGRVVADGLGPMCKHTFCFHIAWLSDYPMPDNQPVNPQAVVA